MSKVETKVGSTIISQDENKITITLEGKIKELEERILNMESRISDLAASKTEISIDPIIQAEMIERSISLIEQRKMKGKLF